MNKEETDLILFLKKFKIFSDTKSSHKLVKENKEQARRLCLQIKSAILDDKTITKEYKDYIRSFEF